MKLYHNHQAASGSKWELPGKQDRKAERVDVPAAPAELAAWLNSRRVPREGDAFDGLVPGNEPARELLAAMREAPEGARQWELGAPTRDPPRYDPKHSADYGHAEFVPITRAAAIAASYNGCPACHRTWAAQVLAGISSAEIDDLKMIADAIKTHVGELNEQLDQAGEARQ